MKDENHLRHVIELARAEINQQKAALALRLLGDIRRDVEDFGSPLLSAEYQLTFAEALAAKNDPASVTEFEDALLQICALPERRLLLELRAHEHFARDLRYKSRLSQAREHCEVAKKLAVESQLPEDTARIQMLHILLTLKIDQDPRIDNLQNLKQAATRGDFTARKQLAAWFHFCGESELNEEGMIAARKRGSAEYFEHLLRSIREEQRDEIPG